MRSFSPSRCICSSNVGTTCRFRWWRSCRSPDRVGSRSLSPSYCISVTDRLCSRSPPGSGSDARCWPRSTQPGHGICLDGHGLGRHRISLHPHGHRARLAVVLHRLPRSEAICTLVAGRALLGRPVAFRRPRLGIPRVAVPRIRRDGVDASSAPTRPRLGPDLRFWSATYMVYLLAVSFPQSSTFPLLMPPFPLLGAVAQPRSWVDRMGIVAARIVGQCVWLVVCWWVDGYDWTPP